MVKRSYRRRQILSALSAASVAPLGCTRRDVSPLPAGPEPEQGPNFGPVEPTDSARRYGVEHLVDAQVHVWLADTAAHPWPETGGTAPQKDYPVPPESILLAMDLAGVDRAIVVPPSWQGNRNDVAIAGALRYPERFAVMGRIDLFDPDSPRRLEDWTKRPGMLGLRCLFHDRREQELLKSGALEPLWDAAQRHDVPVSLMLPKMPNAANLIERMLGEHPTLRVSIDHLNSVDPDDLDDMLPSLLPLAKYPNLAMKATALPTLSRRPHPFEDVHDAVRMTLDEFGPRRVFWGTDLTRLPCSYHDAITMFTEHMPWLDEDALEWVMGRGVSRWYGWPL